MANLSIEHLVQSSGTGLHIPIGLVLLYTDHTRVDTEGERIPHQGLVACPSLHLDCGRWRASGVAPGRALATLPTAVHVL